MSVHDLKDYRQSKLIVKDIEQIRLLIRSSFKELNKYKKYLPVKTVLNELLGCEVVMKTYYETHKKVIEKKGKL